MTTKEYITQQRKIKCIPKKQQVKSQHMYKLASILSPEINPERQKMEVDKPEVTIPRSEAQDFIW